MAQRKSLNLLPQIFQTDINDKFLSATIDQLISEPSLQNINGYIGRKFAPTYKSTDSYLIENNQDRQNYQLEPGVLIKNESNETVFFASYIDFLNKVKYYGGIIDDHSRLFENDYYSFDPGISLDKLVNFGQYYWLPNGPDSVLVNTTGVELVKQIDVTRNTTVSRYDFSTGGTVNNTITLARGGSYTFVVNQPGHKFWIQSELGIDGLINATPTLSTRDVLGVINNGADTGEVIFNVPQSDAQDRFTLMNTVYNVDYATPLPYANLHNRLLSDFLEEYPQYAGITGQLNGKTLVFVDTDTWPLSGEEAWLARGVFDRDGLELEGYDAGTLVPENQRYGVWQVLYTDGGTDDPLIRLVYVQDVAVDEKVYIKYGLANANKEYYKESNGLFYKVPLITAPKDTLYIQDGTAPGIYTTIKLVESTNFAIDVENDILSQPYYTSPNGVDFTSGLKVRFETDVTPEKYQNKEYYVENVGDSIRLIDTTLLVTPEAYNTELAVNYPDQVFPEYITIKRDALDLNPWSRNNRWFHIDVIIKTAEYNRVQPTFNQRLRAQRPIIQFEGDFRLFNNGRIGKPAIDILDIDTVDPFNTLEGKVLSSAFGVTLYNGMRVLFGAAADPLVRDKIYTLNLVQYDADPVTGLPTGDFRINLTIAEDGNSEPYDTVVVKDGRFKGSQWWYDGDRWLESQQKTILQQDPLFDLFDSTGTSFSDATKYPRSSFVGSPVFGYQRNSAGTDDAVLGFPLTYKNFITQGDIQFFNYYSADTFSYVVDSQQLTQPINTGFLQKTTSRYVVSHYNTWRTVVESSRQYQIINTVYDGNNQIGKNIGTPNDDQKFFIDVLPETESTIPYLKVFVNNRLVKKEFWDLVLADANDPYNRKNGVHIFNTYPLTVGDKVDIQVYSKDISKLGHYQVPINLDLNAQGINLETLTLGQMRNHLVELNQNNFIVEGDILGSSNLRDLEIKNQGGTILQHSAPTPYASLFLLDDQANFVDAVRYAQREYAKFKNKFLEMAASLPGVDPLDPVTSVDLILTEINKNKTSTFPWFYSDMVPYGAVKTTIDYTIFDPLQRSYEITNAFDPYQISGSAVLVYLNNQQLTFEVDYVFSTDRPAIEIKASVTLDIDDKLTFVEYPNTNGSFIPETPSKLGLYPKFVPEKFLDDTYVNPSNVIRGHDGSLTPAFDDYRDSFILELERRIYNNIKLPAKTAQWEMYAVLPGKFRDNDYSLSEVNRIISKGFLNWVGNNKLDYSSNTSFQNNNPFTWNYSNFVDRVDGEFLPGSWRACYQYFYDTDVPHLRPWEMLGFAVKPDWWEGYYGPAPYAGTNKLLWDHLEQGFIVEGDRQGYDSLFARPGLSKVIPVDENGYLLSPAAMMTAGFNATKAATAWAVGQWGPVETAWRRSSDYAYSLQIALALAKPAKYFGLYIDRSSYKLNTELTQYLDSQNQHLTQDNIGFNGDISSGTVSRHSGYLNWIADYLVSKSINPSTKITTMLKNYRVNLAYKIAGFTDKKFLRVLAEQSSPTSTNESVLIPDENYEVYLYKSTPVNRVAYSGVIVEKTSNGFSVRGYDLNNPYFTIIPSIVNTNAYKITVLNAEGVVYRDYQSIKLTVPYGYEFKSRQQVVDFLISYERYLVAQGFQFNDYDTELKETRNWKLSSKEFLFWAQQGWAVGSLLILNPVANYLKLATIGSIVDGVSDSQYGSRILDQNYTLVKNTDYNVTRSANTFTVQLQDQNVLAFAELNLVQYEHVLIFDNTTVFDDVIYRPELGNRQYRLKVVGQKTANWDGSLYAPGFVYNSSTVQEWQPGRDYLKGELVQFKNLFYVALQLVPGTAEFDFSQWKQLSQTEIKSGLLPNWSTIAVKSQSYYDSYSDFDDEDIVRYSHGLIGFKPRQYLVDLGLTDATQIEFYKGYIREKGSANAVNELTRAEFNNLKSDINYFEEWAVRVGEYGALDSNPYIEVNLDETAFSANPTTAEFVPDSRANEADGITVFNRFQLYRSTNEFTGNIALNRDDSSLYNSDIPTAGYVNIDDVDATIFDLANYQELNNDLDNIGTGYKIWVAKDFTQDWNVYRVTETNNFVVEINNVLDGVITFRTERPHGLQENEIFLMRKFDAVYDGFYQVFNVVDLNTVAVVYYKNPSNLDGLTTLTGNGILMRLDSMRFLYMEDARVYGLTNPIRNWKVGDKIWIDDDAATSFVQGQPFETPSKTWKVYEKTIPWSYGQTLDKFELDYQSNSGFGTSIRMSYDGLIVVAGSPYANTTPTWSATEVTTGRLFSYDKNYAGEFIQGFNLAADAGNANVQVSEYGYSVDLAVEKMVVGAPGSYGNTGMAFVYNRPVGTTQYQRAQVIVGNIGATGRFGSSTSFDYSGRWLYIGAPAEDRVYVYGLNTHVTRKEYVYSASGSSANIKLNFTPDVANVAASLLVTISDRTYIPDVDYTLIGDTLVFTANVPATTVTIVQQPYFSQVGEELVGPDNSEFGYDLDSSEDGAQLAVGAPNANVMVNGTWKIGAGAVYVYDRVIEAFNSMEDAIVGTNGQDYATTGTIGLVYRVTIDDIEIDDSEYVIADPNTLRFVNPPGVGKLIFVETNKFNLLELLVGIDSLQGGTGAIQDGSRFGTSLTICSNNCAIYIGAPKYTANSLYNQGAVWKFHNKGRLYGINTGFGFNPVFTPGDSIRLDNFEVFVSGRMMPTTLGDGTPANVLAVSGTIRANVGDYITQPSTGANVTVLANTGNTGSKTITVSTSYNTNVTLSLTKPITVTKGDYITQVIDGVIANAMVYANSNVATVTIRPVNNVDFTPAITQLSLSGAIRANVGEYITQTIGAVTANARVVGNVFSSSTVNVTPITGNVIGNSANIRLNGVYFASNVQVISTTDYVAPVLINGAYPAANSYIINQTTASTTGFTFGSGNLLINDATYISNNYSTMTATWSNVEVHPMASLDSFVKDVNDAGILGVSAVNQNGYLRLLSDRTVAKNLLRTLSGRNANGDPGASNVYTAAGMAVFAFMQIIINPFGRPGEYFGNKVILARNAYMLVIASERGTTQYETTFDNDELVFDDDSTVFTDDMPGSGSVYIYELYDDPRDEVEHPGRYAYCQQLDPGDLASGDSFGTDIDIINGMIIVSAPNNDDASPNAGKLYLFTNPTLKRGWNLIRYQEPQVDPDTVNRMYLFDNQTNTILTNLEFIDPAKGKILGAAEQDITYKTEYDPAIYNRGDSTRILLNTETYWGDNQVNQVWWNLGQVRFIDYEQGSLAYRAVNWGRLFPGSTVEVCEWVESTVLPSQYIAAGFDGEPKYADDSAYVEITYVDPTTNIITSKYYFWVKNKSSITGVNTGRTLPVSIISNLISNPKSQGIAYGAIIKSNAFILYNVGGFLSANNTVLHLDYELVRNSNLIHSEYELLQSGNKFSIIPEKISNKMIDSLAGIDAQGAVVPDQSLSVADRYGISTRPRQSMFIDRLRALNDLIDYVNGILIQKPIARQYNFDQLLSGEPIPYSFDQNPTEGQWNSAVETQVELDYLDTNLLPVGYKVLVRQDTTQDNLWTIYELQTDKSWSIVRVQSFRTDLYWDYVDWYALGYNANEAIEFVVDTLVDALKLPAATGDEILVKVNNTAQGGWNLLTVLPDGTFQVVGIQNGTIQLKSDLSDFANNGIGFGNQGYETSRFDQNPNQEIRNIIEALRDSIFTGELEGEFNRLFFVMVNYLFNEQKFVDWIFKTSFISVTHNLRSLDQPANYIKDNQTYYEEYIKEVKPYVTKIREYLTSYTGSDEFQGSITDFDLPPYYDAENDIFRSPNGEGNYVAIDEQLWSTGILTTTGQVINQDYPQWYNHRTYSIESIIITDPGLGYTSTPEIIISGGGGSGASAVAAIDGDTGRLIEITVTSTGSGYTTTPTVTVNGGSQSTAKAYAVLTNNQLRSLNTTLKFDRVNYNTTVQEWSANTFYTANTIVSYNGQGYRVVANVTTGATFNPINYELYNSGEFSNANDRIMAYYVPGANMPAKDLKQLVYGIEYPGVQIQGLDFSQQPGFPGTAYANITFSGSTGLTVGMTGNLITQPEASIALGVSLPISANVGEFVTQTYLGAGNVSITANARVYRSVVAGDEIVLVKQNNIPFVEATANLIVNGTAAVRSIYGNVVVDPVTGATSNVAPWGWSNVGIRPTITTVGLSNYVEIPLEDASATVTRVWTSNKLQVKLNNSVDWVLGNSAITFGNVTLDGVYLSNVHVTDLDYISNNDINPFDSGDFDNVEYDEDGSPLLSESALDTVIRSEFIDSTLGTRPEDINVDGGAYVDTYSSHAPEELVPGIMYDTLDMKVYTKINGNVDVVGYRIFKNMVNNTEFLRIADRYSTTLTQPLALDDTEIHVANVAALATPTPSQEIPGIIFIGSERITYWTANVAAGTLGQIRRGTQGTAVQSYYGGGTLVVDASLLQVVPNVSLANISYTSSNTYTVTESVTYQLRLNTAIQANVGDIITQATSGANALVVGTDLRTSVVLINYNNSAEFDFANVSVQLSGNIRANVGDFISQPATGANLTVVQSYTSSANILARYNSVALLSSTFDYIQLNDSWLSSNVYVRNSGTIGLTTSNLAINGTHDVNVYPYSSTMIGNVTSTGEVTFGSGTVYQQTQSWYNLGTGTATDGLGFDAATTAQVLFLKDATAGNIVVGAVADNLVTEDAINTITTESGDIIIEE